MAVRSTSGCKAWAWFPLPSGFPVGQYLPDPEAPQERLLREQQPQQQQQAQQQLELVLLQQQQLQQHQQLELVALPHLLEHLEHQQVLVPLRSLVDGVDSLHVYIYARLIGGVQLRKQGDTTEPTSCQHMKPPPTHPLSLPATAPCPPREGGKRFAALRLVSAR